MNSETMWCLLVLWVAQCFIEALTWYADRLDEIIEELSDE